MSSNTIKTTKPSRKPTADSQTKSLREAVLHKLTARSLTSDHQHTTPMLDEAPKPQKAQSVSGVQTTSVHQVSDVPKPPPRRSPRKSPTKPKEETTTPGGGAPKDPQSTIEDIDRLLEEAGVSRATSDTEGSQLDDFEAASVGSNNSGLRRVSLLYTTPKRGTGVEMDAATKVANDLLQKGKHALETAGNMKRECKAMAHDSLQGLYETVLSLADSRARHKYNLEKERTRHAQELVRVERAHTKELLAMKKTLVGEVCLAREDLASALDQVKAIRSWLGYETEAPFRSIGEIQKEMKQLGSTIKEEYKTIRRSIEDHQRSTITKDSSGMENKMSSISNQLDLLRKTVETLNTELSKRPESPTTTYTPQREPLQFPDITKLEQDIQHIKETLPTLTNKQPAPQPSVDLALQLRPLFERLEIMSSDLRELQNKKPEAPTPSLGTEMAIEEVKLTLDTIKKGVSGLSRAGPPQTEEKPSYAKVAAKPQPVRKPNHTLIISSADPKDTGDNLIERIRDAIDVKTSGARIERLRKAKNQKIVLSCVTKEDLNLVQQRVKATQNLRAEVARATNPQIIIKDVLSYHKDSEIVETILAQNKHLLQGVNMAESTIRVRYRKRARNPHETHPVLELSPELHKRFTEAGKIYIGLQRRPVYDHSPLVQCTKCLSFGHTRAVCKEGNDLCSHCGKAHSWDKCKTRLEGGPPKCRNCHREYGESTDLEHNAFSNQCKERQKWDAIARSRVSYC